MKILHRKNSHKVFLSCTVLIICFCIVCPCQILTTKGKLLVTLHDQLGGEVINARISLIQSGKEININNLTGQNTTQFTGLSNGEYQVKVIASGFKEYTSEILSIKGSDFKRTEIILEVATIESKVDVGGEDEADSERYGATRILTDKEINNLPDDPKAMQLALRRIVAQATGMDEDDIQITVDGLNTRVPPKSGIQQVRINQNIFSAQYESPYGGGIEIFTKSDIKDYHGSLSFNFADSRLNAPDPFLGKRTPSQTRNYDLYLTGPVIPKKLVFSVSANHATYRASSVVNAVILDSALNPVEYKKFFPATNKADDLQISLKSDLFTKHKIILNYDFSKFGKEGQGVGDFSLSSRAYRNKGVTHNLAISDTYLINTNIVSQTKLQANYARSKSFGGSTEPSINVQDAFSGGGSQIDNAAKDFRLELSNDTTWQIGKYSLAFGWKIRGRRIDRISRSNFGGTYSFSGRTAPVMDANNHPLTDSSGNYITGQISSLESYHRTLLFEQMGYTAQQIWELGGGASQFTISGGDPATKLSQYDYSLYLQNAFKVTKTIAASFGVRYENQTNIKSLFNFAPRLGVIWSPKNNEKRTPLFALPKISAGIGLFYTRFGINNFLSVLQSSGINRSQYLITDPDILSLYPIVPSVSLLQQFALPRTERMIDSQLETPYQALFNLNVNKKLPAGFSLNIRYDQAKSFRQPVTENINAPLSGNYNLSTLDNIDYPLGRAGSVFQTSSVGRSESKNISIGLNFPDTRRAQLGIRYSYFRGRDNVVSGSGSVFDPYDFKEEFGPSALDGTQHFLGYSSVKLPLGVSVSGDFSVNSGTRFNITTGRDTNGDGIYTERPAFATDLSKPNLITTKYGVFDPNPSSNTKIIPRNLGRGLAVFDSNMWISKSFGVGEKKAKEKNQPYKLDLSVYINNVLNIVNKSNPIGNMSSPNFLRSISNYSSGNLHYINGALVSGSGGRSMNFNVGFSF